MTDFTTTATAQPIPQSTDVLTMVDHDECEMCSRAPITHCVTIPPGGADAGSRTCSGHVPMFTCQDCADNIMGDHPQCMRCFW